MTRTLIKSLSSNALRTCNLSSYLLLTVLIGLIEGIDVTFHLPSYSIERNKKARLTLMSSFSEVKGRCFPKQVGLSIHSSSQGYANKIFVYILLQEPNPSSFRMDQSLEEKNILKTSSIKYTLNYNCIYMREGGGRTNTRKRAEQKRLSFLELFIFFLNTNPDTLRISLPRQQNHHVWQAGYFIFHCRK